MQIQAVNDVGNLLFFALVLAILVCTIVLVYRKIRGRSIKALIVVIVGCMAVYITLVVGVSLTGQTQSLP